MSADNRVLWAQIIGLIAVIAARFGIEMSAQDQADILAGLSAFGLVFTAVLAKFKRPADNQSGQSGFITPPFACVLISLVLLVMVCSGCTSLGKADQSGLIVQIATMKVIEAGDNPSARAARVNEIADQAQTFLDSDGVTVSMLADAVNARLAALDLAPSDRVLAAALVDAVVSELQARVGVGTLSVDQKYTVSQILSYIESTTAFYGH